MIDAVVCNARQARLPAKLARRAVLCCAALGRQLTVQVVRVGVEAPRLLEAGVEAELAVPHETLPPEIQPTGNHLRKPDQRTASNDVDSYSSSQSVVGVCAVRYPA